jgi:hypothetical protein
MQARRAAQRGVKRSNCVNREALDAEQLQLFEQNKARLEIIISVTKPSFVRSASHDVVMSTLRYIVDGAAKNLN